MHRARTSTAKTGKGATDGADKPASGSLSGLYNQFPVLGEHARAAAEAVRALGTPAFEDRLMAFLSAVVPVDHCAVFTYSPKGEAGHLFTHSTMPDARAEALARDYVERFHDQDPNFEALREMGGQDYAALIHRRPDDMDPAYRNHFFDRTGLIDKTASVGRIEDGQVYCNFYRMSGSAPYSSEDMHALEQVMPLATALVAAHYTLARARGDVHLDNGSENLHRQSIVHNVISRDAPPFDRLTDRERQVCERILLGYTTTGIGLDLAIAPTSVATYRKRAYHKLGIASQNELFSLCLKAASAG